MIGRTIGVGVAIAAAFIGCATNPIGAPGSSPSNQLSKDWRSIDHVVQIDVTLPAADWNELRLEGRSHNVGIKSDTPVPDWSCQPFDSPFDWYEATVSIDGREYQRARIRKKGFYGSLSTTKPALKLRLDKYIDQDHFGTTRLTLNNSIQDRSRVNTCLAYELFRRAGIPGPLCNYANVTVNGDNLGVYVNVEDMQTDYYSREWNMHGDLYEGTFSDFVPGLTGTFEKKTNETEPGLGYVAKVTAAIQSGDAAGLERLIDVDRFITYWALESLIGFHDGYTSGINNYYFHESPAGLVFIPWGPDQTFTNPKGSVMWLRGAVARSLYPAHKEAYKATMRKLLSTVWNESDLVVYMARLSQSAGWNRDTMQVIQFINSRRQWVEGRLRHADFDQFFTAKGPYEGGCTVDQP